MTNRIRLCVFVVTWTSLAQASENTPHSTDPDVVIELFAEHPQLVTPTGLAVDDKGRVFVAESHTHFRPDNYDGPKADRILILEDKDGDGKADARQVFHEGFTHIMDLAFHRDGSLYVATRKDIHRMRDTNGDNKADEIQRIINLETKGNYPHNGISGLAFHLNDRLSFGLGENLGADYAIVGTDGKRFTGGGEGGSTYQVNADGTNLRRVTTGWWNPFGICVDAFDRVFGTDNDPGASPPCRLHQVIEGGNYGYEYRYGRTGLHPLISWTGSNPGNLPMISGTGEAPCSVLAYESDALPEKYLGRLLVASWADHRIEHYKIVQPKNQGMVTTKREILIEAQNGFRPVDLALAPDGTVYVTDWVSSSYTLHKQGRIWRIRPKVAAPKTRLSPDLLIPDALQSFHRPLREFGARKTVEFLNDESLILKTLAKQKQPRVRSAIMQSWAMNKNLKLDKLNDWLKQEPDVRLQQLGVKLLGRRGLKVNFPQWKNQPEQSVKALAIIADSWKINNAEIERLLEDTDPLFIHSLIEKLTRDMRTKVIPFVEGNTVSKNAPVVYLLALRRSGETEVNDVLFGNLMQQYDGDARFVVIKWIADKKLKQYRPQLVNLLSDPKLDYRTFRAVAAAMDRLDGKKPSDHPSPQFLLDRLTAENPSQALLKVALREIDPAFSKLKIDHLKPLLSHPDPGVQLEAIRTLAGHPDPDRFELLNRIVRDADRPLEQRTTAMAGISGGPAASQNAIFWYAATGAEQLRNEALRSLVGTELTEKQKQRLQRGGGKDHQAVRRLVEKSPARRPDVGNLTAWKGLLEGEGDPNAGERIFFGSKVGTCSRCHQIEGRGTAVGPDLTQISRRLESQGEQKIEWLLKTILRPSEDMAPQYTPWIILTKAGKTLTGLPRRKGGNAEAYLGIDGKEFSVKKQDIEFHKESDTSLMPKDLLQNLTDQEIRDLFAFLQQHR